MRVALIGTSGYAQVYLQTLLHKHEKGQIELTDIVSVHYHSKEEVDGFRAKKIRFHSSLADFFLGKYAIDLLCIPTSIHSHFNIARQAIENGYNILLEKPAAATPEQIRELDRMVAQKQLSAFIGFQNLYEPETWSIKASLCAGEIGEIESAHFLGLWPRSESYFTRNEWAGKLQYDGQPVFDSVIHNAFAHFINLLFFWTGNSVDTTNLATSVKGKLQRANTIESFDTAQLEVETKLGVPFYINASHACNQNVDPLIRIEGSKGNLEWFGHYYILNGQKVVLESDTNSAIKRARGLLFENVFRAMEGENVPVCSLDLAFPVTHLASILHQNLKIETATFVSLNTKYGMQRVIEGVDEEMINGFEGNFRV